MELHQLNLSRRYIVLHMDCLSKRVRAFTEGIMVMVCPVLLALALKKVDLQSEGNELLRGSISPLAAFTLEIGLFPSLCLCLSKLLSEGFADLLFRVSKVLVHLCGLLLMALAYGILLLISIKNLYYLAVLIPMLPLTIWRCYRSMRHGHDHDATVYQGCDGKLENSLDFSASVTTLLFLGLEGLALEGQNSTAQGLERLLAITLGATFVTCALGVFIMLVGTVPPLITDSSDSKNMCNVIEVLNIALAIAISVIVFLIKFVPLGEVAWLVFAPLLVSFLVWMYKALVGDGYQVAQAAWEEEEFKPASLELTKVTFTGFLAVSVPTFSDSSVSNYAHGFIFLTAEAVVSGLGWRLLTHRMAPSRALVTAASVASFCAHLCVAAAVIPFATMAVNALK